ncbi:MAG: LysR family transcriptional regulator [Lachnospirales bacterium]
MNTFQIDCFIQVAETLNFARAAERLNVTQPAVTHQIRSLEEELGVKLFRRTTRIVELTQEGILFLEDARNIAAISLRAK